MSGEILIAIACVSSFGFAFAASRLVVVRASDWKRRRLLGAQGHGPVLEADIPSWASGALLRAWRFSGDAKRWAPLEGLGAERLQQKLRYAGLEGRVSVHGVCCARADAAFALCVACALAGSMLSGELALLLGTAGLALGWRLPESALDTVRKARKRSMESHLSGAIEAWCLGLRSGLSFDRSLALYCESFSTPLASELASACGEWQSGLKTRAESLRDLARTYDSSLFERVVESVVRSARFGSPLAGNLEALALESRRAHKASVEEEVMKAPVKMMIPVGTLILPSMLVLVLGPVLLELMEGF